MRVAIGFKLALLTIHVLQSRAEDDDNDLLSEWVTGNNELTFELLRSLDTGNNNILISPFSLTSVLGMLFAGARGNTTSELAEVLRLATLDQKSAPKEYRNIAEGLKSPSNENFYTLRIVNGLAVQSDCKILPTYNSTILKYFGGKLWSENFTQDESYARKKINEWVSLKTDHKIPKILDDPLDPNTKALLINAIRFKSAWYNPFEEINTVDDYFYNNGTDKSQVPMMRQKRTFLYYGDTETGLSMVELPYKGDRARMIIILPTTDNTSVSNLIDFLTFDLVRNMSQLMDSSEVDIKLPKFHLEDEPRVTDALKDIGLTGIFTQGKADLSGIDGSEDLFVKDVIQKATFEVTERGSEASAASVVQIQTKSLPFQSVEFFANRPFLFLIQDVETEAYLFAGKVNSLC